MEKVQVQVVDTIASDEAGKSEQDRSDIESLQESQLARDKWKIQVKSLSNPMVLTHIMTENEEDHETSKLSKKDERFRVEELER